MVTKGERDMNISQHSADLHQVYVKYATITKQNSWSFISHVNLDFLRIIKQSYIIIDLQKLARTKSNDFTVNIRNSGCI